MPIDPHDDAESTDHEGPAAGGDTDDSARDAGGPDGAGDDGGYPTADRREKLAALRKAATYNPRLGAVVLVLSIVTALLEGIGIGFILPIIESTQGQGEADGMLQYFQLAYDTLGVPFVLETLIGGLVLVMLLRFTTSFVVSWLRAVLDTDYRRTLRWELFDALTDAPIGYIDDAGSDDLLNTLITEANQAGAIVTGLVDFVESTLRGVIYLSIAFVLSPILTVAAVVGLVATTGFTRIVLEGAYAVGDDIAEANEQIQTVSQAGIQGTRDVRLFGMRDELRARMRGALQDFFDAGVRLERNKAAMSSANQFLNALVVFGLLYLGIAYVELSIAELGVFLFALFRLAPLGAQLNNMVYGINGMLPHLVRVSSRIRELEAMAAAEDTGDRSIDSVERVAFEDVSFAYDEDESVLEDVSFDVERGEHVALVGQSGAGKSTIISLLARLRDPDDGRILADGTPIDEFDLEQWRDRVAVVRQDPYVFDETLYENVTVGKRDATRREVERVCEVARVTEFLDDLPNGYDTVIGEDGIRLSGGQKQRVAIARALLKDADVLLFDEATSDLDSHIEQAVQAGIDEMTGDYATISIAHQLSTVRDADCIYALVDGAVAEAGTHEELVERGGFYADLYATQTGGGRTAPTN